MQEAGIISTITRAIPWAFLSICVIALAVFIPISFTIEDFELKRSRGIHEGFVSLERDATLDAFERWAANVTKRLYIVVSTKKNISRPAARFTKVLEDAAKRGVEIRIYTNSPNITGPEGSTVKLWPRTNGDKLYANIALGDDNKVFTASSFFQMTSKPILTYALWFHDSVDAAQDVENLIDVIWETPAEQYRETVLKRKWIGGKGYYISHDGVNFMLDPSNLYPLGRNYSCYGNISYVLSDIAMERFVVTPNLYQNSIKKFKYTLDAVVVTGMFEQRDSFMTKKADVFVPRYHLTKQRHHIRSLLANCAVATGNWNSIYQCPDNVEIDGTVAFADNIGLVMITSGIGDIANTKNIVLGVTSNDKNYWGPIINAAKESLLAANCTWLPKPIIN